MLEELLSQIFIFLFGFLYPANRCIDADYYEDILCSKKLENIIEKKRIKYEKFKWINIETENKLKPLLDNKLRLITKNMNDFFFEKKIQKPIDDPYLYIIEQALTKEQCDEIIDRFETMHEIHYTGHTGGGYTPTIKKTTEIQISRHQEWSDIDGILHKNLTLSLEKYAKHIKENCNNDFILQHLSYGNTNDSGYQIQKYLREYEGYSWHHDSNIEKQFNRTRILTFLWYLNDVQIGGETYFYHGKIKPKCGNLCLFPATWNYNHKAEIPISNDKYIITGWITKSIDD